MKARLFPEFLWIGFKGKVPTLPPEFPEVLLVLNTDFQELEAEWSCYRSPVLSITVL